MKKIEKTKILTPKLTALILAIVLSVSLAASLVIYFALGNQESGGDDEDPVIYDGESLYYGRTLAYPTMEKTDITSILVENEEGAFLVARPEDGGSFEFAYKDEETGAFIEYMPPISDDENFKYEDLYAIEMGDDLNYIPRLDYLCAALQLTYYSKRIDLNDKEIADTPEKKQELLDAYGLSEGEYQRVTFSYKEPVVDENGEPVLDSDGNRTYKEEEAVHTIKIGCKTTLENGHYFMVDDREVVYQGYSSVDYFGYALEGLYAYINPILIAPSLDEDTVLSAYFTNNYYQWIGKTHNTVGEAVEENSKVVVYADMLIPIRVTDEYEDGEAPQSGYVSSGYHQQLFDLNDYKNSEAHNGIVAALTGSQVGSYEGSEFTFTLKGNYFPVDFGDAASAVYTYDIIGIESVFSGDIEYNTQGYAVGENNIVKVAYKLRINGESSQNVTLHAIIDISDEIFKEEFRAAMRASSVGSVSEAAPISTTIEYKKVYTSYTYDIISIDAVKTAAGERVDAGFSVGANNKIKVTCRIKINDGEYGIAENIEIDLSNPRWSTDFVAAVRAAVIGAVSTEVPLTTTVTEVTSNTNEVKLSYVITEILAIYNSEGREISKVEEGSIVSYRYRVKRDGELGDEEYVTTVMLGESTSEAGKRLSALLIGKEVLDGLSLEIDDYTEYCEYFSDFISWSVKEVKYFVTRTMVSGFRFQNRSERDPYYGESIYENTIDNKYAIYGISNSVCEKVVNILTGIKEDTTSAPGGLIGITTVEVGITPELLEKYGLYANEIYFEMPRGVYTVENPDPNEQDDYKWYDTLAFTLYISDEQPDGTRYIASDMYDIIAKVDGENFVFLDYDFVNFWARQEMMLTDVLYLQNIKFDLNFDDLKGNYDMDLAHKIVWWSNSDHKRYEYLDEDENESNYSETDEIRVDVTASGECTPNLFTEKMNENGFLSLTQLYNDIRNAENGYPSTTHHYVDTDPLGTSHFMELLQNIYYTKYEGVIPADEQEDIIANSPMVLRISFKLGQKLSSDGGTEGSNISAYSYVYEYYRYSDNRVLVRLYQAVYDEATGEYIQKSTPVSDFYISTFALKRTVDNFTSLMNGEGVSLSDVYGE